MTRGSPGDMEQSRPATKTLQDEWESDWSSGRKMLRLQSPEGQADFLERRLQAVTPARN